MILTTYLDSVHPQVFKYYDDKNEDEKNPLEGVTSSYGYTRLKNAIIEDELYKEQRFDMNNSDSHDEEQKTEEEMAICFHNKQLRFLNAKENKKLKKKEKPKDRRRRLLKRYNALLAKNPKAKKMTLLKMLMEEEGIRRTRMCDLLKEAREIESQ